MTRNPARSLTAIGLLAAAVPVALGQTAEMDGGALELDEVVVTGSRISRAPAETPHPLLSFGAGAINASGLTNVTDYLTDIPALIGSTTTLDTSGFGFGIGRVGLNLLDLRNLGTDRTLVLVNGRRHIAGEVGSAAVDINSIPVDLLERIDVLTGGMSAIYGADGVSGVVNFVTRRDFSGLSVRGQSGLSGLGDAGSDLFSITAGENFAGGAGNVALSYEFSQDDRVRSSSRPRIGDPLRAYEFARNPLDDPENDDPDLYDYVVLNDLRWLDSSPDGAIDADGDLVPDFRGGGGVYDTGEYISGSVARGGSSTPVAGYDGDLRAKTRRHVVNLLGSFEVSDSLRLFAEGKYANSQAWNAGQPTFGFYNFISEDNPLIPQQIRDAMVPGAVPYWFDEYLGETVGDGVFMTRDHLDLARRGDRVTRETLRSVVGIEGRLSDTVRYEASHTFGQTEVEYSGTDNRIEDRFFAALDVVDEGAFLGGAPSGVLRCRIDLQPAGTVINPENILADMLFGGGFIPGGDGSGTPQTFTPGENSGCVPLNLFGEGVADPAALEWINTDARTRSRMSHHVVSGSLSGELDLITLPGGPMGWAAGAEYRKENSRSTPDEWVQQELLSGYPRIAPERGSFDVKEAFGEVNLPLLRDAPLAHRLSVGGAVRLADYSTIGNATTWKADAVWAPVRDITMRGTWSQAVRAPNIGELFAPLSGTYESVTDPCDIGELTLGPAPGNRQANCTELLTQLGIDPATFQPSDSAVASGSIPGALGGNPELSEETAKSWTAGFVLTPRMVPGLRLSLDWYRTRLKSAISYVTADELVALCVDAPSLDNAFCESITRNAFTGFIDGFELRPQNVARFTAAGADLALDYSFTLNPDWGRFALQMTAGYVNELTFISMPGAEVIDDRHQPYIPMYSGSSDLTWSRGDWDVNFGTSYFSKTRRFTADTMAAHPDYVDPKYVWYKASWSHDLQVAYSLRDRGLRFYGGANNLFNAGPDFPSGSYPNGWLGRYFYAGFNYELDR